MRPDLGVVANRRMNLLLVDLNEGNVGVGVGRHIGNGTHQWQHVVLVNEAFDSSDYQPEVRAICAGVAGLWIIEDSLHFLRNGKGCPDLVGGIECLLEIILPVCLIVPKLLFELRLFLPRFWRLATVLRPPFLKMLKQQNDERDMAAMVRV